MPDDVNGFEDVLALAAEGPKIFIDIIGQQMPFNTQRAQPLDQFHHRSLADQAIGVADNGDLLAAFHGASQRQRPHGTADRAGDDIAGVSQPDKLLWRDPEHGRQKRVEPRVDASQGDERQLILKIRWVQAGIRITGQRAVVGIDNGFEQAHNN